MNRRRLLLALAAITAAPFSAAAGVVRMKLGNAFEYLERYLAMEPADRTHFTLAYRALRNQRPAPDLLATMVEPGGARTSMALSRDGFFVNLPGPEPFRAGAILEIASKSL